MKDSYPVSVIVITYNEERNIGACLNSLFSLDYPERSYEVIVVDGDSSDRTQKIVNESKKKHKNLKLIIDKIGSQTTSRNLGIRKSNYNFIAFTDADCLVPKNWLEILVDGFKKYHKKIPLAGVGGANIPPKKINSFTKAIGIAFDSWLGSLGSIQAKPLRKDSRVFSISCTNALYDKSKLFEVGLFPAYKKKMGDDWILGLKLKRKGYFLVALKNSFVWHKFRSTPYKFLKNMILYGKVRMNYIIRYPADNSVKYFLPLLFMATIFSAIFFPISKIFFLPLLYFPTVFVYSLYLTLKKKKPWLIFHVLLIFLLLHFGYSLGELIGLKYFFIK